MIVRFQPTRLIALWMLAIMLVSACSASNAPAGALPAAPTPAGAVAPRLDPPLSPAVTVKVAVLGGSTGAMPFYVGQRRGYFSDQGINLELVDFPTSVAAIPSVATGQVHAVTAQPTPAFFNAINQGVKLVFSVDVATMTPGNGFQALVVRPALASKVKEYKDLKGLKIAVPALGTSNQIWLERALTMGGLTEKDITLVALAYGDMSAALANGSIDAGTSTEPFVAQGVQQGIFVRFKGADEVYPNQQQAGLAFNENFAKTEAAKRVVVGFVRSIRDIRNALVHNVEKPALVKILTETTTFKDPAIWDKIVPPGANPDGYMNVAGVRSDIDWFFARNLITTKPDVATIIDNSFADYAVAKLGKYEPPKR